MDCIVHGVTQSQIQLSDVHFHFFFPDSQNLLKLLINGDLSFYLCLAACTQSCSLYSHSFLHVYQIADVAVVSASVSTLYLSKFHPK